MSSLNHVKIFAVIFALGLAIAATGTFATDSQTSSQTAETGTPATGEPTIDGAVPDIAYPDWFKDSFLELSDDIQEAAEFKKRVVLLFHQDGCPYCNAFVEQNLSQKDIVETLQTKFDVIELNIWGDREIAHIDGKTYSEKEFSAMLKVQFTPTVIFLTETAELALRVNGYQKPSQFRVALDYVATQSEKNWTFNEYLAATGDKKKAGLGKARPYFAKQLTQLPSKSEKPFALLFEQKDCPNCEALHANVLEKPEAQEFMPQFELYRVDMWSGDDFFSPTGSKSTGRELAKSLGVNYAPTLILFSKDGHEIIRGESFLKSFHTVTMLDYMTSGTWREQPNFQRYVQARADRLLEEGHKVNIWE